ncbi:hypothetical protein JIN85_06605 [Luteolibacter pohnpeiensis]|uniref:Probable sensor domain-containing protein n=1 Tax=Luteolibacter pohnpeiensis TaxID=454153 RepID=A0A934SB46_9BACT|nr:hypothetical protein [Luteolibacter pohnpeiensis]MBK1882078.1 hypothetical protein [Luteolibacter pohnpeiensis]
MTDEQETSAPTLAELVHQMFEQLSGIEGHPSEIQIRQLCDWLYAASLLKEEGRAVRARVIIAPPDSFESSANSPDSLYVIRFAVSHGLSPNEIKRISPAASFFHSAVGVWPDRDRGFRIWGIINTGPRWLNLVAGGRKPMGKDIPFPVVHIRDPGWLLFYDCYSLIAEWRGREFHGPRIDVFQSNLLQERFDGMRRRLIGELANGCLPDTLDVEVYSTLAHQISLQFVKRIINLVRTSGHGGSLVVLPAGEEGQDVTTRWIDCKYSAEPNVHELRFRTLLKSILRRVGQLSPKGADADEAWEVFKNSSDSELDEMEEAFFELARFFSDLMQVDGALIIDNRMSVIGFGGEIRVDRNVLQVGQAHDLGGTFVTSWNVQGDGTRHRSVYRLCSVEPSVIGFVISQDSQVRMIANVNDSVVFWAHSMI